jgi:S-adenosylhomocysteine hydrolase
VEEKKDGHRAYTAERKAKLIRLTADLRNSDTLLTEFVGKPEQTDEEVSTLAAIAGDGELTDEGLAAVAGGVPKAFFDNNCGCSA